MKEQNLSLSIVIPVYKGDKYLSKLIESIANLRFILNKKNAPINIIEVIFVNDSAIDQSKIILDNLSSKYNWIQTIELSKNFGQHAATIAGICHTQGDWVVTLDEDLQHANPTNFSIGVAGYPEKHFEAPNMKNDLKFLKQKIEAGAEYIVTQLFYDNAKFKAFVETCRKEGINVPIIPGIKPISTKKQVLSLPKFFHIDLPDELVDAIEAAPDANAVKQVGIDWAIKQSKDLIEYGVPCIHYYTMGKSIAVREVVKACF